MKRNSCTGRYVFLLFFPLLLVPAFASHSRQNSPDVLAAPIVYSENFPCTACHVDDVSVSTGLKETYHVTIRSNGHVEGEYDCFDCHDARNMDKLRLFNGKTVDLSSSSKLCGQCHSTNYTLWQSGLHGKVSGKWAGPVKITPCTACHDPHQPVFLARKPAPPPVRPEETLRWPK